MKLIIRLIRQLLKYLKENNSIDSLIPLLKHEDVFVRFLAAVELLEMEYQSVAVVVLEEIRKGEDLLASKAKIYFDGIVRRSRIIALIE